MFKLVNLKIRFKEHIFDVPKDVVAKCSFTIGKEYFEGHITIGMIKALYQAPVNYEFLYREMFLGEEIPCVLPTERKSMLTQIFEHYLCKVEERNFWLEGLPTNDNEEEA